MRKPFRAICCWKTISWTHRCIYFFPAFILFCFVFFLQNWSTLYKFHAIMTSLHKKTLPKSLQYFFAAQWRHLIGPIRNAINIIHIHKAKFLLLSRILWFHSTSQGVCEQQQYVIYSHYSLILTTFGSFFITYRAEISTTTFPAKKKEKMF